MSSSRPTLWSARKLNRIGLLEVGDISWPEHVGIFTIPVRAAVQFGVPLIVWGENSQNEYGGPAAASDSNVLTRRWLEEFGGLLGLRVTDLPGMEGIEPRQLHRLHLSDRRGTRAGRGDRHVPRPLSALGRLFQRVDLAGERLHQQGDDGRRLDGQLRESRQSPDRDPRLFQVPEVRLRPRHRHRLPARSSRAA